MAPPVFVFPHEFKVVPPRLDFLDLGDKQIRRLGELRERARYVVAHRSNAAVARSSNPDKVSDPEAAYYTSTGIPPVTVDRLDVYLELKAFFSDIVERLRYDDLERLERGFRKKIAEGEKITAAIAQFAAAVKTVHADKPETRPLDDEEPLEGESARIQKLRNQLTEILAGREDAAVYKAYMEVFNDRLKKAKGVKDDRGMV